MISRFMKLHARRHIRATSSPSIAGLRKAPWSRLNGYSLAIGRVLSNTPYVHLRESRPHLLQPFHFIDEKNRKTVYEITLEVDEDIAEQYLEWMRSGHIQEALALPGFEAWDVAEAEQEATTKGDRGLSRIVLVERYLLRSRADLETYFTKYSKSLRDDHARMWPGKVSATRRIMQAIGQQTEEETSLWKRKEERNKLRLTNLTEQLKQVPFFTEKGWHVQKTPPELWRKIQAFYNQHQHEAKQEQMNPEEITINSWAVPTSKLEYPLALAQDIISTFAPILQTWSGISALESTGLSGVRTYKRNNTIAEHVDLAETNVISALINIDQKVDQPWPFQIRDHMGRLHVVEMQPGDVIIYESATCAHLRGPLNGDRYANTFMRFRPQQWTFTEGRWSLTTPSQGI